MSGCHCFPGFVILPVRMHLPACLVFSMVIIFLLGLKIYFHSPSGLGQVLFLTLELNCKGKKKRIKPSHESIKSLHFSTWPQIKGSSHEINLLYHRKYKHDVE